MGAAAWVCRSTKIGDSHSNRVHGMQQQQSESERNSMQRRGEVLRICVLRGGTLPN